MNQEPPSSSDKKDQAAFFMNMMKEGGNWDEYCIQWCKQKSSKGQTDPNCSMVCLKRPVDEQQNSWNPLKGYRVLAVHGKDDCIDHTKDMGNESTQYELDLGSIWNEADRQAKQLLNDKAIPLYNASVEQIVQWGNSPELQDYIKDTASSLLSKVYPLKPFSVDPRDPST
ncbi:hypothetical protein A0J61_04908 [Choanephora cucurbitarum]|uniref:Uncharacterized protein n=1 Tax=Choanephora cucurbitarum TaxID=101091 RepID=A0A1C7ND92_9FUNG|nr:hypothetical protein A0J61_04908 [Choanephora cucurbitarum]